MIDAGEPVLPSQRARLGLLVAGSVAEGLSARLDPAVAIEDVRLGKFVKIVGQKYEYFCLVTDVQLDSANADVLRDPPGDPGTVDVFLRQRFRRTQLVGDVDGPGDVLQ